MDSAFHQVIDDQLSTVAITASVAEAIAQLSQTQHPCLVVIEPTNNHCLGLFTERHGIDLIARGLNTLHQPLAANFNSGTPTVPISILDSLDTVAALFDQHQLLALPVVNDANQPIGLITRTSLWRGLRQGVQRDADHPPPAILWCAEGTTPEIDNPLLKNIPYPDFVPRWVAALSQGEHIHGRVADFPASERLILEPQGIQAILILPLLLEDQFFGFIGFDNCESDRSWDALEIDLLSAAAAAISLHQRHVQSHQKQHRLEQALRLTVEATAASGDRSVAIPLSFEVEDTGSGIAPDDLPRLFKPFVQTRTGQQYNEGTGLDLTISQRFVQLMGGTITVESVVGRGSTFRFQIPVMSAITKDMATVLSDQPVVGLDASHLPCRLLIVEDHWENQQVLLKMLQPLGFDLQMAQNGQAAIVLWAQWQPHAILMDIRMPIMDGYEAIQQIRAQEQRSRIAAGSSANPTARPTTKIIAVTSGAFDQERSIILESGCDDFISKPFQEQELLTKLAQHLGLTYRYGAHTSLGRQFPQEATATLPERPGPLPEALTLDNLSTEWVFQLHQAAVLGRDTHILQLIQQLPEPQSQLSRALSQWVEEFQFEPILALTRRAGYD